MIITKAVEADYKAIASIGKVSVGEAHRESCTENEMADYLERNYNEDAIAKELNNIANIYHLIHYNNMPVGFSKIVFNSEHPNIRQKNVTKLDRIYLLSEHHNRKLGFELLKFNIALAKNNRQAGIWLFTWVGNSKAIDFYLKTGFKIIGSDLFKISETHYNRQHHMFLHF